MNKFKLAILPMMVLMVNTSVNAEGLIEDSKLDLMNRNFYFYRDFREGAFNTAGANTQVPVSEKEGYRSEWAHGIVAQFQSGFTDTPIQLGFNFHAMGALKLYSDEFKTGTNILEFDGVTGDTKETNGEFGGALKFKYKDTTLTYGDQFPNTPVIAVSTVRLLPSTVTGISVQDKSFDNLTINAAHFYRMNPVDTTENLNYFTTDYATTGINANSISYLGGSYKHNDVTYTAYASELEDVWNQYFIGANITYKLPKEGHAIRLATANYYNTDTGDKKYGDIDALALSALVGYQYQNHTLSLGYQQIIGDDPFDWVGFKTMGANTSILNAAQFATFSESKEKSVQAKYDVDFTPYGVQGLSLMARYLYGWDIDKIKSNPIYLIGAEKDNAGKVDYTHWERDITLGYKVPTGFAKGLDIKLRQATHRATKGYRYNDIDELRVILEYPLSF
ncbi:OprD family outer membrane porin [Acinetobacter thermotolerans]|uniref:OprD family outer membrane porin n=1 Tax=Acinetobacter thermotolerans TaxID=3151487 RepID=UPI00325AC85D